MTSLRVFRSGWLLFSVALLGACVAHAQEPFPGEPANAPQPQAQQPALPTSSAQPDQNIPPIIRVNTSVVLVPTLVEKSSGEVVYGLAERDFTLEDNGVSQKIHVDDDLDTEPMSLIVCVQRGRSSALEFNKIAKLGPLLELFTGQGRGEVGLVVFDSRPVYLEGFTRDTQYIEQDLQQMQPGDGGAAILDAVGYSVDLLEHQPPSHRRVLLLISESRDHGSKKVTESELVQRIGISNTLVLSLTFSPSKAEFLNDIKFGVGGAGNTMNLMAPLRMAVNAMKKNAAHQIAYMSGGEYAAFTKEKGFEDRVAELASHARNRYILSFHPTDPTPGLHTIQVKLNHDIDAQVVARASYWAVNDAAGSSASNTPRK